MNGIGSKWVKVILSGCGAPFVIYIGVRALIKAYEIPHPQIFIMYFFSASFISLVGLVMLAYFAFNWWNKKGTRPTLPSYDD